MKFTIVTPEMSQDPITFKRKEIVLIFAMLVGVSGVVFGLGIFVGKELTGLMHVQEQKMMNLARSLEEVQSKLPKESEAESAGTPKKTEEVVSASVPSEASGSVSQVLEPVVDQQKSNPSASKKIGFTIQVMTSESLGAVQEEKERLMKLGYPSVFIQEATLAESKLFFLDFGFFKHPETAKVLAQKLFRRGVISQYVIRKTSFKDHEKS
ncbi:MAG: hypothetical protein HY390_06275 [Deltaproteobacteria bacterium]|nr:hypothetical protein [Deltaproteobacteria bacterium]